VKHIGIVKPDNWINILNWLGIPLIIIYFVSMFMYPFLIGKMDWSYTQNVWHNWQSLNVGMLAFISSLIAFNISRINAEKQRGREFIAARAFLPEALTSLSSYLKLCSPILKEAWYRANDKTDKCKTPLKNSVPELPLIYKDIFSRCIAYSESDVAEHLARILTHLQIHHSRLESLKNDFSEQSDSVMISNTIMSCIYSLGELQALINRTYDFARGQEGFNGKPLKIEEFWSAYFGLDIEAEDIGDLSGFTQRAVKRKS